MTLAQAQRVLGGDAVDGAQVDPVRGGGGLQAYDQRISGSYSAGLATSFPAALSAGQVLVKARALDPVVGNDGYMERYDVLHVVAQAPTATQILPAAIGWAGRGTPAPLPFDAPARLAELATYDATGISFPPFATLMAALDAYPVVFAQNTATNAGAGYERLTPSGATGAPGSGYAYSVARVQVVALFALTADPSPYTSAQRLELYRKIVRIGIDMADPILGSGTTLEPDGGHHQAGIAVGIEALRATGRSAQIAGFRAAFGGSLMQYFRVDQAYIDAHKTPHDALLNGALYRRRALPSQTLAGANEVRIPTQYGGSGGVHGDADDLHIPPGSLVTRESDGATAVVGLRGAEHYDFPNSANADMNLGIDAQPTPAFAQGDVVYIQWPPGIWELGDAGWMLRGFDRPSLVSPSAENRYAGIRSEGAQALWLDMQGILPADMDVVLDMAAWADQDDVPSSENDWPALWGNGSAALGTSDIAKTIWRNVLGNGTPIDPPAAVAAATALTNTATKDVFHTTNAGEVQDEMGAFPGVQAGDTYLMLTGHVNASDSSSMFVSGKNGNTTVGTTVSLADLVQTPGGSRRELRISSHVAAGSETSGRTFIDANQTMRVMQYVEVDTSEVTLTGAVALTGTDSVTFPGAPLGATVVALALSADGDAPSWSGAIQDHAYLQAINGSDNIMTSATGRVTTAGDLTVTATGAEMIVAILLAPV